MDQKLSRTFDFLLAKQRQLELDWFVFDIFAAKYTSPPKYSSKPIEL